MKILIFGKGYVGEQYLNSGIFKDIVYSPADITKLTEVKDAIIQDNPDVVINAAGKTNLEWCRKNEIETLLTNIAGPLNILKVCSDNNISFVQLSSGCIFDGAGKDGKGFTENDEPGPASFYAHTKAVSDGLLMDSEYNKLLILRLRQPFGLKAHPRSIITKILNFNKAIDSQQSITFIPDLIEATKFLLDKKQSGIFNIANKGTLSPYDIAELTNQKLKLNKTISKIDKAELDKLDKLSGRERRVDTIVNIKKLLALGFEMPPIKQRIDEVLATYKVSSDSANTFAHK